MAPRKSGATETGAKQSLLSAGDVARAITRMAHQVIEKNALGTSRAAPIMLLGIPTRGVPLAHRLVESIAKIAGERVPCGTLDVTLYRDDLHRQPSRPLESTELPESGIDDRLIVLVDDVLFSGRTIRAALDAIRDIGRPRAVQLAVLVDRGHRELPIKADYVGKNIPTALSEKVAVLLAEIDGVDEVLLRATRSAEPR